MGRTFIQPAQFLRQLDIRLKFNPLREMIAGRRLIAIDDSIAHGDAQQALVYMLHEARVAKVHMKISSPSAVWPCLFGIDFPTRAELTASSVDVEGVQASIDVDSLPYLSMEGIVRAVRQGSSLYLGYFNNAYLRQIPEDIPIPGTPGAFAC